ncbi:MAG: Hsp33 family molecular chaperone HslO [Mycoplasmataceae bacterium]|nr:Hsp33 family molecular chaperone HslO [Mycoplasmataceae bacterium]
MSNTKIIIKGSVRIYLSDYTDIAQTAIEKHETLPLASLALSSAISVFAPIAHMKKQGSVSVLYKFDGPLKNILVESSVEGTVRALVGDPGVATEYDDKDVNAIPIGLGIGETGKLKVVNTYNGKSFGGVVDIVKGDVVTDLAWYFDQSEQTKTAIVSDVQMIDKKTIKNAYSAIYQLLPSATADDIEWIETFIKENKMSSMTIDEYEKKINGLFLEAKESKWQCVCSSQKMLNIIDSIPKDEQESIIKEHGKLEIKCNYCNTIYTR